MAGKNEVSIWIRAKDLASTTFKKFERSLNAAWRTTKTLAKGLAAATAAAAALTVGVGKLAERGGKYVTVSKAFARNVDDQAAALRRLQDAAGGMISKFDLMQGFNQAIALGSAENVEQFEKMVRISQQLARSLGIDMDFALNSLNTGIARQSRLYLDNLGIIISVADANKAYAATLGKQVSQLTDAEKREAFRAAALAEGERIVAKMGESTGGAGDAWVRLTTAIADGRDRLAEFLAESPEVQEFFDAMTEAVDYLAEELPGVIRKMAELGARFSEMLGLSNATARNIQSEIRQISDRHGEAGLREHEQTLKTNLASTRQQLIEKLDEAIQRGFIDPETGKAIPDRRLASFVREDPERRGLLDEVDRLETEVEGIELGLAHLGQVLNTFAAGAGDGPGTSPGNTAGSGSGFSSFSTAGLEIGRVLERRKKLQEQLTNLQHDLASAEGEGASKIREEIEATEAALKRTVELANRLTLEGLAGITPDVALGDSGAGEVGRRSAAFQEEMQFVNMTGGFDASQIEALRGLGDEAEDVNATLLASVGAFQAVGTAALRSGENLEQVLLPSLTNITAAAVKDPVTSAIVGAVGGLLGAMFNRNDRPLDVNVRDVDDRAARKLRNEDRVRDVFINGELASDERVRQLGYRQGRIARLRGESPTGVG